MRAGEAAHCLPDPSGGRKPSLPIFGLKTSYDNFQPLKGLLRVGEATPREVCSCAPLLQEHQFLKTLMPLSSRHRR